MLKLQGTITAMVTPFDANDNVDYGALRAFVDWQCENGVEGICAVGTSGESPTLSHEEHHKVIEKTIEFAAGRVKIIAGTGANSTAEAVSLTRAAIAAGGADASLQVTPYYNKPNAEGIYRHFATVADLGLPIVLYNVPGRSGREIPLDVVERLARHPNVVAIKEAAGSVERVSAIKARCPDFTVLSGDDSHDVERDLRRRLRRHLRRLERHPEGDGRLRAHGPRRGHGGGACAAPEVLSSFPRPLHRHEPDHGQGGACDDEEDRPRLPSSALRDDAREARADARDACRAGACVT